MSSTSAFPKRCFICSTSYFGWIPLSRLFSSLFLCVHVDVYRLVSQLTLTECGRFLFFLWLFFLHNTASMQKLQWLIFGSCQVHERQMHAGRRKSVWSRLAWCTTMVPLCSSAVFSFYISYQVDSVLYKKWCGENLLDHSQRCDLILLQACTFLSIQLRAVHWRSDVDAIRTWIRVTPALSLPRCCHKVIVL